MYITGSELKRRWNLTGDNPTQTVTYFRQPYGQGVQNLGPMTTQTDQVLNDFEGWALPDFHKRLREGELIPFTPYRKLTISGSCVACNWDAWQWVSGQQVHHWCEPEWYFPSTDWLITSDELKAAANIALSDKYVTNAAAKIYSEGFDALTWLAELKDIRHLWKQISEKLLFKDVPRNMRGLSFISQVKKRVKAGASDWLSYRYGWRQLYLDFKNLNEAINGLNETRSRYSKRAGLSQTSSNTTTTIVPQAALYNYMKVKTDKLTVSYRGTVAADIEVPEFQFSPLQTAWELLSYSFVLDWFVNVGKTLSAISFLAGAKAYTASRGVKVTLERSYEHYPCDYKSDYISGGASMSASNIGEFELREPCRVPYFPHFALNIDDTKIVDLVSLIIQRLK